MFADNFDENRNDDDRAIFATVYDKVCSQFQSRTQEAGTNPVTLLKVNQQSHEKTMPGVPDVVFRLVTKSSLTHNSVNIGDGRTSLSGKKGSFYLAPANAEAVWESEGSHQLLMLAVPEKRIREILSYSGISSDTEDPLRAIYGRDLLSAAVPNLMENIWRESLSGETETSLLVDGLFMTLLGEITRLSRQETSPRSKGDAQPLDKKRLAIVAEYIDAHLDEPISLEELAGVACLSVYHFARCFKAATNTTPHAFVTMRRLEAGRLLLANQEQSLAEIAYACGFSSQAHFTSKFKDYVGVTPGVYRSTI